MAMAAAGFPAGRQLKASSPNCFRMFFSAAASKNRRSPPFSIRQRIRSRSRSAKAFSA